MKKVFIFAAVISVAFATFAFSPADKNNLLDDAQALTELEVVAQTGTCDSKYKVNETFTECDTVHTGPAVIRQEQADVLGTY